jgi:hypothetical protein
MRIRRVLAVCILALSRPAVAQTADYVPSQRLAEGRELVAIYIGSTDCAPCQWPPVKSAVRAPIGALESKTPR